ncbi:hypothetical protein PV327_007712 [Microctonus hyperodae]|uniref:Major facilitator superfamily (MFS) profile domain-containing protein n=1 Tax=Microctonus hyperodae TaxID=165561 RepID=A0AA39KYW5_MICHY|nr:hypothetical protein PV327_007712 [Microctonus hyperodae]
MTVNIDRKIRWIYVASFLDLFAVSLILPSMSAYLKSLGASYFLIGGMTSIYACTQLISGPLIGSWSDKIGRQNIFIVTYMIVSCCYLLLGLINSLYAILIVRAVIGIFKHGQVLLRTIVTDQVPLEKQTQLFGQLKSVAAISFTLGPAIGGHLTEFDNGFTYICCCAGILLGINIVIGYLYLNDLPNKKLPKKVKSLKENIVEVVRSLSDVNWFTFGKIFALKFILDMSAGLFHSNYNLKLQNRFDISPKLSGYTIAFQSFIGVITGIFIDYINNKFYKNDVNYRRRNIHGFMFTSIAYLGIFFTTHLTIFLLWTTILTSGRMFLRIILTDMLMKKCPPSQTGSIAGSANSISNLARLITPLTAGFFEDYWGINSVNFLAAIVATIGIIVSWNIERTTEDREKIS